MARRVATKPRKLASQERSRATVAALVEATARILVSEGFDKASTNRIAEVAGVSVGSLYQYFPGKEALVVAVAERHNGDIMRAVGNAFEDIDSLPVAEAVRKLVDAAIRGHRVDPKLHRVLAEEIPHTGELEIVGAANRAAQARFKTYLESRADDLGLRDAGIAAFVCAASIEAVAHNAVLHHAETYSNAALESLIDETSRLIVGYLTRS